MHLVNSNDIKKKAWIEISEGWQIRLFNIPNNWALGYALYRYFSSITPISWPLDCSFLRLDCINCKKTTFYDEAFHISDPYCDYGQILCKHCNYPWLTFYYYEEGDAKSAANLAGILK